MVFRGRLEMADGVRPGQGSLDVFRQCRTNLGAGDWQGNAPWIAVIGSAFQFPAGLGFAHTAPLFEEKGDICRLALILERGDPRGVHEPGARAALAADDHPMDSFEVYAAQVFQKRLDG